MIMCHTCGMMPVRSDGHLCDTCLVERTERHGADSSVSDAAAAVLAHAADGPHVWRGLTVTREPGRVTVGDRTFSRLRHAHTYLVRMAGDGRSCDS